MMWCHFDLYSQPNGRPKIQKFCEVRFWNPGIRSHDFSWNMVISTEKRRGRSAITSFSWNAFFHRPVTLLSFENRKWMKWAEVNTKSWGCLSGTETWISLNMILVTYAWKLILINKKNLCLLPMWGCQLRNSCPIYNRFMTSANV
jgi:hypothetical protein